MGQHEVSFTKGMSESYATLLVWTLEQALQENKDFKPPYKMFSGTSYKRIKKLLTEALLDS